MACGEAGSREEAEGRAAEMFCNLLVEKGVVDRREIEGNLVPSGPPPVRGPIIRPPVPPAPLPAAQYPHNSPQPLFRPSERTSALSLGFKLSLSCVFSPAGPRQAINVAPPTLPPPPITPHPGPAHSTSLVSNYGGPCVCAFLMCIQCVCVCVCMCVCVYVLQ